MANSRSTNEVIACDWRDRLTASAVAPDELVFADGYDEYYPAESEATLESLSDRIDYLQVY